MPAVGSVSSEEITRSQDTSYIIIEISKVTKVLKRLGIAFANYICALIAVENIDYIPWIAIWSAVVKACREVCPEAKIVIQTELSKEQNVTNFYKTLSKYTSDYDVIGISYYPYFHGPLATLEKVIKSLEETYPDKKIEIVETGYYHKWYPNSATYNLKTTWPDTNEGQRKFTADLVEVLNKHQSVDGLYWWFPEANEYGLDWSTNRVTDEWYNASLWDNETGRALPAIKELKNFRSNDSAIKEVKDESQESESEKHDGNIYDLQGRKVADNTSLSSLRQGIYIYNGKKIKK